MHYEKIDPKLTASKSSRPKVAYAPFSSINQHPYHEVRIVISTTDMGRVGTHRIELVEEYTGQTLFAYAINPSRLGNYNV